MNKICIGPDPIAERLCNAFHTATPLENFSKFESLFAISPFHGMAHNLATMFAEVLVHIRRRSSIFPLVVEKILVVWQCIPAFFDNHARVLNVGTVVVVNVVL